MIGGYIGSPIGGIVVLAENTITAIATITEASDTLTAASKVQIRSRMMANATGSARLQGRPTGNTRIRGYI